MANDLKTTGYVGPVTQVNTSRSLERRKRPSKRDNKPRDDAEPGAQDRSRPPKIDDYA